MKKLRTFCHAHGDMLGYLASGLSVIMFISLIEILLSNLDGGNIYLQPIATSFSGLFWFLYGYGKKDMFIIVPNLIALVLGVCTAVAAFL